MLTEELYCGNDAVNIDMDNLLCKNLSKTFVQKSSTIEGFLVFFWDLIGILALEARLASKLKGSSSKNAEKKPKSFSGTKNNF